MEPSAYLSTLIGTGEDAMSNLWEFSMTDSNLIKHHARVTGVTIPLQDRKIIEVPYMNTKVYKKTPFVDLDKKFSFNIRIDRDYEVYKALLTSLNAKTFDMVNKSETTFTAVLNCTDVNGGVLYNVTFKKCSVVSMGKSLQYSYDSSRPIVIPVTVIYESKEEDDNKVIGVKTSDSTTKGLSEEATQKANEARWWVNTASQTLNEAKANVSSASEIAMKARADYQSRS